MRPSLTLTIDRGLLAKAEPPCADQPAPALYNRRLRSLPILSVRRQVRIESRGWPCRSFALAKSPSGLATADLFVTICDSETPSVTCGPVP
jgi:hypothetical protein